MKLCFATQDITKISQLKAQLDEGVHLIALGDTGLDPNAFDHMPHPQDRAAATAKHFHEVLGIPTLAEATFILEKSAKPAAGSPQQELFAGNAPSSKQHGQKQSFLTTVLYFYAPETERVFKSEVTGSLKEKPAFHNPEQNFVPEGQTLCLGEMSKAQREKLASFNKALQPLILFLHKDLE